MPVRDVAALSAVLRFSRSAPPGFLRHVARELQLRGSLENAP